MGWKMREKRIVRNKRHTMRTSDNTSVLEANAIITKSGRVFYPYHQEMLDNLPEDIVQELARRELEKIKAAGFDIEKKRIKPRQRIRWRFERCQAP